MFKDADWALLVGAKPRGPGMERSELLSINGEIFQEQVRCAGLYAVHVRHSVSYVGLDRPLPSENRRQLMRVGERGEPEM